MDITSYLSNLLSSLISKHEYFEKLCQDCISETQLTGFVLVLPQKDAYKLLASETPFSPANIFSVMFGRPNSVSGSLHSY
jgi:hypothetical protein